jgi:hypothetical protein
MYRITTVGSLPLGLSSRLLAQRFVTLFACLLAVFTLALYGGMPLHAQSTSGGGIQGTVVDPDGKVVVKAQVTATNTDTGVATTVSTTDRGVYAINNLQVGTYNVEVVARGFQRLLQENVNVDNASMFGLNLKLTVGGENTTITVTDAPPYLDTQDATLGGTIENELYTSLPLSMQGGPRDPTAFQYLMPGVQENPANATNQGVTAGVSGIYGGTGQANLNANYVEGVPVSNIAAQGSGTQVANAVSVDAVNQFSVQTSGASVSFGGAGVTNYTINSGGNQFHGTAFDFVRNTMFDTWGYTKVPSSNGIETKPGEHQNSYGASMGGPIFKDKLFFFGSYEGYRYTKISNTPLFITIPTMDDRQGNFTDLCGTVNPCISDPTVNGVIARTNYQGLLNGVPTYNVMPSSEFSTISLALQAALPLPTSQATFNNYLASLPLANNDYDVDVKIDYTINSRNKFSLTALGGVVGYSGQPDYSNYTQLPVPYAAGKYTNQKTASGILSYTYIASQTMINSVKYGFTRNWGNGFALTAGKSMPNPIPAVAAYFGSVAPIPITMPAVPGCNGGENACAAGITNLPPGNASADMPAVSFSGGTTPANWASTSSTGPQATNAYTLIDNLTWIKNRHNVTIGAQAQWLETNGGSYGSYSQSIGLSYQSQDTGQPYASFLIGAVYSGNVHTQSIQDVGARYRPISPYIQDNWQVSPKLTVNLGFRYDYLQPYHEVHDRIAYLNPTTINPIVGVPGVLEFAGFPNINNFSPYASGSTIITAQQQYDNYAPYICHCTTPVKPYNKNFEPRVGFAYAYTPSLVFSASFGLTITHAGGVGGGQGATQATGNNGEYSSSNSWSQTNTNAPNAFYLTTAYAPTASPGTALIQPPTQGSQGTSLTGQLGPNIPCVAAGTCNPFTSMPPWTAPSTAVNPLSTTGNYDFTKVWPDHLNDANCSYNGTFCNPGGVNFADPYYGGRGPQFISYSFGIQKMINKKAVFSANYSGTQTHFLPGGSGRGYAQNTYSPDYDQLFGTNDSIAGYYCAGVPSTSVGYAAACPNGPVAPYPLFGGPNATIENSLRPFPQFGGFTDLWGNTGNANYNSLQLSVTQRPWHNLSGFLNYTRAKTIDNTGTHRTQFPVSSVDGNFPYPLTANQVDRGLSSSSQTNAVNLTWVYTLPIGRGQAFFATNRIAGMIGGGWEFSGIYKYRDGYPLQLYINGQECEPGSWGGQGTCMMDYNPNFNKRQARINGRWGRGPGSNASTYNQIQYINPNAFECPDSPSTDIYRSCNSNGNSSATNSVIGTTAVYTQTYKTGNVARSAPDGLHGPGWWDVDLGIRRTFNVRETATLHLTFQVEADVTNTTNSTFFNFSGSGWENNSFAYVNGQNQQIVPRDWQFAGRFRF